MPKLRAVLPRNLLDMSQEARLARAREQGFDTDQVWYHGTQSDIGGFDPDTVGRHTQGEVPMQGSGAYLTLDPEAASRYATGDVWGENLEGANVLPLYTRGNIFNSRDFTKEEELRILRNLPDDAKPAFADWLEATEMMGPGDWYMDEGFWPQVASIVKHEGKGDPADVLRAAGYDGVRSAERFGSYMEPGAEYETLVIFDPSNLRSTNAAFDTTKRGSPELLAGVGGAALLADGEEAQAGVLEDPTVDEMLYEYETPWASAWEQELGSTLWDARSPANLVEQGMDRYWGAFSDVLDYPLRAMLGGAQLVGGMGSRDAQRAAQETLGRDSAETLFDFGAWVTDIAAQNPQTRPYAPALGTAAYTLPQFMSPF